MNRYKLLFPFSCPLFWSVVWKKCIFNKRREKNKGKSNCEAFEKERRKLNEWWILNVWQYPEEEKKGKTPQLGHVKPTKNDSQKGQH